MPEYDMIRMRECEFVMKYESIASKEIDDYVKKRDILIIDLREPVDYKKQHIVGAVNIEYESLVKEYKRLPIYKTLLLYCERGGVSTMASNFLSDKGYHVINVIGGFHAYKGVNVTFGH